MTINTVLQSTRNDNKLLYRLYLHVSSSIWLFKIYIFIVAVSLEVI